MDPKIPLPTDNIYKFLALFGLIVMISSMSLLIYITRSTNELVWENANAIFDLDKSNPPYKEERAKLLTKEIEIAVTDRDAGKWGLAIVFALGFYASLFGFWRWYKDIQPTHDEILALQRDKLRAELNNLLERPKKPKINE